jgi:hypothetical protein
MRAKGRSNQALGHLTLNQVVYSHRTAVFLPTNQKSYRKKGTAVLAVFPFCVHGSADALCVYY